MTENLPEQSNNNKEVFVVRRKPLSQFLSPIQQEATSVAVEVDHVLISEAPFKAACSRAYHSSVEGHLDHKLSTALAASESERGNKGPLRSLVLDAQTRPVAVPNIHFGARVARTDPQLNLACSQDTHHHLVGHFIINDDLKTLYASR